MKTCKFLLDASNGSTPLISTTHITNMLNNLHTIYTFNWGKHSRIKTPTIKITDYNKLFDVTYTGKFSLGRAFSTTENNEIIIVLTLLIAIYADESDYNKYGYLTILNKIIEKDYIMCLKIFRRFGSILSLIDFNKYYSGNDVCKIKNFYEGQSVWLHYWNEKESTQDLKDSNIYWCEKFALTNLRKYEMIMEMYNRNCGFEDIPSHNIAWILCEFSKFLKAINCPAENITQLYKSSKQYIDNLSNFSKVPDSYKMTNYFEEFDELINSKTRNLAEKDTDFDKNYYKPWVTASRSSNAYAKKEKLELIGATAPTKPGRKLGQKAKGKDQK